MVDPKVPEDRRHCAMCDSPVGRSVGATPGRTEGFCRQCGHPFSFTPKLATGDLVAKQYEVQGCLAHGGLGWIYLARDRNVADRWVALKGLLNTGDPDARAAALAERRFLAEVEHPNIVKIYNFVEHEDDGYIVIEFVDGSSLRDMLQSRRDANDGRPDPLPVAEAIAFVHEILPAIGHLHDLGLMFCDFKPDNVIQCANSLKLIDLGGVYSIDNPSSAIYGTMGFQAPEIAQTGPTIPSDLFTVGRTLAVLCTNFRGYQSTYRFTLPAADEVPEFAQYDSLYRFLHRATANNPDDRFQSADEMAAQLLGVLREVVAAETGTPRPGASSLFTGELRGDSATPDWHALPAIIVSADDTAAGYLATIAAGSADTTIEALERAPERTVEVELRLALTLIQHARLDEAGGVLNRVLDQDPWEWRVHWYRGLSALSAGDPANAREEFDHVYREVPGELAPKLALGFASELVADVGAAARWYDIVSRTDPGLTGAAFGLARTCLAADDTEGAMRAFDRVPERSNAYVDAQIAKAETMLLVNRASNTGSRAVTLPEVVRAAAVLESLPVSGERRTRLEAELFEAAIDALEQDGATGDVPSLLGRPLTEQDMRFGLEASYRSLARSAPTAAERIRLVDTANRVRPRTLT
jgi:serine/threonine-protein kinase PknG